MAGQKQDQAQVTRAPRVQEAFDTLRTLTEAQEAFKDQAQPVADFRRSLSKVLGLTFDQGAAEIVEALGAEGLALWQSTREGISAVVDALTGSAGEINREQGDAKAKALRSMIDADMLDPSDVEEATELVTRWSASAPKSAGGARKSSEGKPSLGFTVQAKCEHAGCDWRTSTGSDNLNSIRDLCLNKHLKKAHSVNASDATREGLSEAFCAVGMTGKYAKGEAKTAQGGGFLVTVR